MDQAAWAARIRAQMNYEWQREGPPEGSPSLPPIPTGRYTDEAFYELEQQHLWKKSWLLVGRDALLYLSMKIVVLADIKGTFIVGLLILTPPFLAIFFKNPLLVPPGQGADSGENP